MLSQDITKSWCITKTRRKIMWTPLWRYYSFKYLNRLIIDSLLTLKMALIIFKWPSLTKNPINRSKWQEDKTIPIMRKNITLQEASHILRSSTIPSTHEINTLFKETKWSSKLFKQEFIFNQLLLKTSSNSLTRLNLLNPLIYPIHPANSFQIGTWVWITVVRSV